MSADNGIYILKTKDQFRVAHAQAIERVYDDYYTGKLNPIEVVLIWGQCRYTRDKDKAYKVAEVMSKRQYTEYGISIFNYNKTWKHIVDDAKKLAQDKKEEILKTDYDLSYYDKYRLQQIERIMSL